LGCVRIGGRGGGLRLRERKGPRLDRAPTVALGLAEERLIFLRVPGGTRRSQRLLLDRWTNPSTQRVVTSGPEVEPNLACPGSYRRYERYAMAAAATGRAMARIRITELAGRRLRRGPRPDSAGFRAGSPGRTASGSDAFPARRRRPRGIL